MGLACLQESLCLFLVATGRPGVALLAEQHFRLNCLHFMKKDRGKIEEIGRLMRSNYLSLDTDPVFVNGPRVSHFKVKQIWTRP